MRAFDLQRSDAYVLAVVRPTTILPKNKTIHFKNKEKHHEQFFKKVSNFFKSAKETALNFISRKTARANLALASVSGEGYVDTGVKIIIAVVVGGVLLAGLYALFNTTIIPTLTAKISQMFNYSGT